MKRSWAEEQYDYLMDADESDLGQLLCYLLGHFVKVLTNNVPLDEILPILGIYIEGTMVRISMSRKYCFMLCMC